MILTAHQPVYAPWLGLFDKIAQADLFVLFDICPMDSSSQTSFENRNKILAPTGEQWLTVPVRRNRTQPLSELEIAEDHSWQRKHWRSIELAYHRAPCWDRYAPGLAMLYDRHRKWTHLVDLNEEMLRYLMGALGLYRPIVRASSLGPLEGDKSDLVLSMCKAVGATEYIFGAHGRDYADVAAFSAAGVKVRFQEYEHPTYPQLRPGFVPFLSVIDLLFNVGLGSLEVLRNGRG